MNKSERASVSERRQAQNAAEKNKKLISTRPPHSEFDKRQQQTAPLAILQWALGSSQPSLLNSDRGAGLPRSLAPCDVLQLQRAIGNQAVGRLLAQMRQGQPPQKKESNTGLPDNLKIGVENLSGVSMDDVKVHYNSSMPSRFHALAYTQGTNIYVGTGQERHLPHEAWHVVQQKQGRVQPRIQAQEVSINDDATLEREADEMSLKALQMGFLSTKEAVKMNAEAARQTASGPFNAIQGRTIGDSSSDIVQRKIGFEFEEGEWRAWINRRLIGPRPAERHEVLHTGTDFELQADDTLGVKQPTLEFVTKPFEISEAGMGKLTTAMERIKGIMDTIAPFRGRDETEDQYVQPHEHKLSNLDTRLSRGHSKGMFKMQATHGISLEDLPTLLKYLGDSVPDETPLQQGDRARARALMRGTLAPGALANVLGNAPSLAGVAVKRLWNMGAGLTFGDRQVFRENTERLEGFLSLLIIYVKMLAVQNGGWVKYMIPLMARTDFATMFMELGLDQRTALSEHNSQALIDAVIHAANSMPLIPKGGGYYDTGYTPDSPLLRNYQPQGESAPIMQSLTISAWLRSLSGNPPVDYLNPEDIQVWLKNNEPNLWFWDRSRQSKYLESLSLMKGQADLPDRVDTSRLVILENRGISPSGGAYGNFYNNQGNMAPDEMGKAAKDILLFFMNLKSKEGAPGAFPDTH